MAKSAQFDRDDVIHKAMLLYWEKGFHATTMRNLQHAVDMRPGSIYAEFGSKEGMFKAAIEHYVRLGGERLEQAILDQDSPLKGLASFVFDSVKPCHKEMPNNMCMLAKTVAELSDEQTELLSITRNSLRLMEQKFADVITRAQALGEVNSDISSQRLAQHLQIQIMGIRTYIRTARCTEEQIEELVLTIFNHAPFTSNQ
ncbi:TetR/AcrR family transcriptional regulator [Vibrio hangzhouensis]|uniref:TetR/AcrR family transcriptional regulator n=1 Tax=Vibrio hangzhouensis TaxID=462991 RepID=UPI001C9385A0|nr:TetR/AcrR family transcriptional regulator [Vibrio hangzhouensis]MBY6195970.1 TetR/AcrR family transcriptional regulator [Vibrio hangzhouensis]